MEGVLIPSTCLPAFTTYYSFFVCGPHKQDGFVDSQVRLPYTKSHDFLVHVCLLDSLVSALVKPSRQTLQYTRINPCHCQA